MSFRAHSGLVGALVLIAMGLSCSANQALDPGLTGGNNGTGAAVGASASGGSSATDGNGATTGIVDVQATQATPGCGNGMADPGEECDDSNTMGGDGCSAACRVEEGWTCPAVGPCSAIVCGDGILTSSKECDDGNTMSGDGCSATCQIEPGWQCRVPGKKCVPFCGDGILTATEQCDDDNTASGDGCSSTCNVEPGFSCTGTPSVCVKSVCGNGVVEAGESCDAGTKNGLFYGDGTGCSKTCTVEPKCRDDGSATTRACDTHCGDGNIDDGEQCDDGNQVSGDGCSSTCMIEPGFTCTTMDKQDTVPCMSGTGNCLELPITFRDFDGQDQPTGHPDFFFYGSTPKGGTETLCVPNSSGRTVGANGTCTDSDSTALCPGIAATTLGVGGKPTLGTTTTCPCHFTDWDATGPIASGMTGVTTCTDSGGNTHNQITKNVQILQSAASFKQWYTDDSTVNTTVLGTLELAPVAGGYQFSSSNGRTVDDDLHDIFMGTTIPATNGAPANTLSSGFFPLDDQPRHKVCNLWEYWLPGLTTTCVTGGTGAPPQQWDARGSYTAGVAGTGGPVKPVTGVMRNFYMTTEARYLFKYSGSMSLAFYGDDDVWVYINGVLALDLGAPHERLQGSVTVTGDTAAWTIQTTNLDGTATPAGSGTVATLGGLVTGKIYEIAVFHADVHPRESNYQLTLSGFSTSQTYCGPTCGDGVVTAGEECDLGTAMNTGDYGGCTADCHYGPWCGDGITNGPEQCDAGAQNGAHYTKDCSMRGCTTACTLAPCCGDGQINAADGEACDDGDKNGTGRCQADCTLGPPK
jgi:fibro-slime domain-containing protein